MWQFHFVKRELETLFVHVFSNQTMPAFNLFKNCFYYWAFAALNALFVRDTAAGRLGPVQRLGVAAFFVCEALNFHCHVVLRRLRPRGSTAYVNPPGPLFRHVACPNYTFEILSWVSFSLYSRCLASYAFTLFGFLQINAWAEQKRVRLNKTFGAEHGERRWRLFWGIW